MRSAQRVSSDKDLTFAGVLVGLAPFFLFFIFHTLDPESSCAFTTIAAAVGNLDTRVCAITNL